jgi:mannose-6-phosphate isomerase
VVGQPAVPAQGARGGRAAEPAGAPERGPGRRGLRAGERRRHPVDAPTRNYRDASHKPELICALTEFHALVGFREVAQTLALLRALDVAELAPHVALLSAQPDAAGLRALFTTWITLPQSVLDRAVPALQTACVRLAQQGREFAARRGWRWSCPSATRATRACSPRCCST